LPRDPASPTKVIRRDAAAVKVLTPLEPFVPLIQHGPGRPLIIDEA
jgi:hypothetical protein